MGAQDNPVKPPIQAMAVDAEEAIYLAGEKWERFNEVMLAHTAQLQAQATRDGRRGAIFRGFIIVVAALATVSSALLVGDNQRYIATMLAGLVTVLTGIEAYFQFNLRRSEAEQQQREVEALRYKLRHQWVITVQMETNADSRLKAAKEFLEEGQKAYNVILNNYVLKRDKKNRVAT